MYSTFGICSTIQLATNNRDIEFGVPAAVLFCKGEDLFQACFFSLRSEIQQTTTEELLFRTDSFCTRFLSATLKNVGGKYLKSTLAPIFREVEASPPIETHIDKLADPTERKDNIVNLVDLCASLLGKILKSIQKINPIIAHILLEVYNQVHDIYPRAATKSLGAILFLRFLFPALTQPVQHKIVSSCSPALSRKVIIVAKIMQCIFNEVVRREDEWSPFAPFIVKHIDTNKLVHEMLLVAVKSSKVSKKHFPVVSKNEIHVATNAFFKLCKSSPGPLKDILNDNSIIKEMLLANHRQSLIMNSPVKSKEQVFQEGIIFIEWLQSGVKNKSQSTPRLSAVVPKRSSFADKPIQLNLLGSICNYLISQHIPAQLFLKYIRSTTHSDTLYFLDMAVNEFDHLKFDLFSVKIIIQALYKYLTAQPLLGVYTIDNDSDNCHSDVGVESKQQNVEFIFRSISKLGKDTDGLFKINTLFTLFESLIICSDDPPISQLSYVDTPFFFNVFN